jgi:hypothetical protein
MRARPKSHVIAGAAALVLVIAAAVVVTGNHHHRRRPAAVPVTPFVPSATEQTLPTTAVSTTVVAPTTLAPAVIATTTRPTTTTSTTPPVSLPPIQPGWVSMANIHGVGPAQSAVFHLPSHDTKLRWVNSGPDFLVYVVDATKGLDATAGYADAECSGPCATDAMALVEPPADYYLLVRSAGGSWAVAIEQYLGTAP